MEKKRKAIEKAPPVHHEGMRYEAVYGKVPGIFDEAGSVVAAYDEASGALRWQVKVYDHIDDHGLEGDKRTILISALRVAPDGRHLEVEHERGGRFLVDLETRAVETISA